MKTFKEVQHAWKMIEMAAYPEWLKANKKRREKIIKSIAKIEADIFKKFLNNNNYDKKNI